MGKWVQDKFAWTCTAGGAVVKTLANPGIAGTLLRLDTDPGAGPPTANYDITLVDNNGVDMLAGNGANRHTTTTESVAVDLDTGQPAVAFTGGMVFNVTNAGNATSGIAYLTWRK